MTGRSLPSKAWSSGSAKGAAEVGARAGELAMAHGAAIARCPADDLQRPLKRDGLVGRVPGTLGIKISKVEIERRRAEMGEAIAEIDNSVHRCSMSFGR
jgi:hypothetical protein